MDEDDSADTSGPDFLLTDGVADMDALVENDINSSIPGDISYTPVRDVSTKFVKYLLTEKKIPAELPLALTVKSIRYIYIYSVAALRPICCSNASTAVRHVDPQLPSICPWFTTGYMQPVCAMTD